jgi:predicted nucleic acid-binding protein
VASQLVNPEGRAALAAADRARRIDPSRHARAVHELEELYQQLRVVAVDEPLARMAGDLAERYALRGYDAVHLASALSIDGGRVVLATWDEALASAAHDSGRLDTPAGA